MKARRGSDDPERLENLRDALERDLRGSFLQLVAYLTSRAKLRELERLLEAGRVNQALGDVDAAAQQFATDWTSAYERAAHEAAEFFSRDVSVVVAFDQVNFRAVDALRAQRARLIREITQAQREAVLEALTRGITLGLNPREQALAFRDALGLTARQVRSVENYRRLLEEGSAEALERALRDRRFDRTVAAATRGERALASEQVERMVERYRERMLAFRAETIARTEALRAANMGTEELYRQAADRGILDLGELVRKWWTAKDARVRDWHVSMHGQERAFGQPFVSGVGNLLLHPGDPDAPAEDTVNCRCVLVVRFASALLLAA